MTKVPEDCREGFYRPTLLRVAISSANLVVFAIVALVFATHGLGIRGSPTSQVLKPEISRP